MVGRRCAITMEVRPSTNRASVSRIRNSVSVFTLELASSKIGCFSRTFDGKLASGAGELSAQSSRTHRDNQRNLSGDRAGDLAGSPGRRGAALAGVG